MRRRFAVVVAVLVAAGCGSYRRVAPLDDAERAEMETLRASLAGKHVVATRSGETSAALDLLGVDTVGAQPVGSPAFAEVHGARAMGVCMNPMLWTVLTLGVLPYTSPHGTKWSCRFVAADGREHPARLDLDDTSTSGWLGLPLALLPGRSAFFFSDVDDEQKAAIRARLALFLGRNLAGRVE